jgi:hypothetical protein
MRNEKVILAAFAFFLIFSFGCSGNSTATQEIPQSTTGTAPGSVQEGTGAAPETTTGSAQGGSGTGSTEVVQETTPPVETVPPEPAQTGYTMAEVSIHNSASDCWMAIDGKVYDATEYVETHPDGNSILDGCGQDATAYFSAVHSQRAWGILSNYYIGELK